MPKTVLSAYFWHLEPGFLVPINPTSSDDCYLVYFLRRNLLWGPKVKKMYLMLLKGKDGSNSLAAMFPFGFEQHWAN